MRGRKTEADRSTDDARERERKLWGGREGEGGREREGERERERERREKGWERGRVGWGKTDRQTTESDRGRQRYRERY